jgi:hypothetical protein
MRRSLALPLVMFIQLAFVGCSTMQSIDVNKRSRVYQAEYITVFKAVIGYCEEKAFAIIMADKDLGIINTDWKENSGVSKFFIGNKRVKINFSLKEIVSGKETRVVLTISAQEQGLFGTYQESTMTESQAVDAYNTVFGRIQQQISSN